MTPAAIRQKIINLLQENESLTAAELEAIHWHIISNYQIGDDIDEIAKRIEAKGIKVTRGAIQEETKPACKWKYNGNEDYETGCKVTIEGPASQYAGKCPKCGLRIEETEREIR